MSDLKQKKGNSNAEIKKNLFYLCLPTKAKRKNRNVGTFKNMLNIIQIDEKCYVFI